MYQYKTLVFTGKDAGKKPGRDIREALAGQPGFEYLADPAFFHLGSINYDRTVVATVLELCRKNGNCNAIEVYEAIKCYTQQLVALRAKYKGFPEGEDFEFMTLKQVKQHLSSVMHRSEQNLSKFIPRGIKRLPGTDYFVFDRNVKPSFQIAM